MRYYHGSFYCLPVGTILRPAPAVHGYNPRQEQGIEAARPSGAVSRERAVFAVSRASLAARSGAAADYVYEIRPLGRVSGPYDGGWMSIIVGLHPYPDELADAARSYWSGERCRLIDCAGTLEWLLEDGAKIVRVVSPQEADAATCAGRHARRLPEWGIRERR